MGDMANRQLVATIWKTIQVQSFTVAAFPNKIQGHQKAPVSWSVWTERTPGHCQCLACTHMGEGHSEVSYTQGKTSWRQMKQSQQTYRNENITEWIMKSINNRPHIRWARFRRGCKGVKLRTKSDNVHLSLWKWKTDLKSSKIIQIVHRK